MGFCVCGADDNQEDWQRWDDHPARKQWDVVKDLGAGAMSTVVLARNKQTGSMAALKVVFLESPAVADDPEHLTILQREADLLAMLEHPNLVELKDVIRSPRQLVLVLEWLRGGQVIDKLHELGLQYSEQQAASIFVQVAEAVAHLHEYGVLHRDIKPENVMFASPPGELAQAPITAAQLQAGKPMPQAGKMPVVKLVDLGMACLRDPANPVTGPLGSPGFVAPEIIHGAVHMPSMDVFSLGVLLFIMLVGRKPFNIKESESLRYAMMALTEAPGLKDPRWLELSPDAKHLVMGMLAYDPARRLSMPQVLAHEWVSTRGGVLPRPLGQDVVFGAATVASVRRLRNMCGGVVAFNRVAAAAGGRAGVPAAKGSASASRTELADNARDVYLQRLKESQRMDPSFRRGNAMHRLATSLASSAYAKAHDTGGSIHPKDDVSVRHGHAGGHSGSASQDGSVRRRYNWKRSTNALTGGSVHGAAADPSTNRRLRNAAVLPGGMLKSPTSIMLSEMERRGSQSREASLRAGAASRAAGPPALDGDAAAAALQRRPSTLQLLTAAAKVYMEGSVHGSRRGGSLALAAGAAATAAGNPPAAAAASSSNTVLRAVADDGSAKRRQQLQPYAHLGGVADISSASSASSSSNLVADPEGRHRAGTAARPSGNGSGSLRTRAAALPPGVSASPAAAPPAVPAVTPLSEFMQAGSGHAAGTAPHSAPGSTCGLGEGSTGKNSSTGAVSPLDGLRPHRVVQRRSLENPLAPAAGTAAVPNRSWTEMQAHLRQQQTPRSTAASREGTASGTPSTRVRHIKPLE
ncbi:Calcium/calmodulin-dependent protein kinase type IV [Chlorella vulgaris]